MTAPAVAAARPGATTGSGPARVRVRPLQRVDYDEARAAMQAFTAARGPETPDEIWLIEHPPVYTQGLAGRPEHLHADHDARIPVVRTERGGQITYHGPGQLVAYTMIDLHRRGMTVRSLVDLLEDALIGCLAAYGVAGLRRPGAPGVYVADARGEAGEKIASLGLKISRGRSYHGLALNVTMDLAPFAAIDPCGYAGLAVTDVGRELARTGRPPPTLVDVAGELTDQLLERLGAGPS